MRCVMANAATITAARITAPHIGTSPRVNAGDAATLQSGHA
jgi:hypothetical protein